MPMHSTRMMTRRPISRMLVSLVPPGLPGPRGAWRGGCRPATLPAYYFFEDLGSTCSLSVPCSGPHPFTEEEPLAAEFTVVSVERLDGHPAPAEEIQVASLETPAPSQR